MSSQYSHRSKEKRLVHNPDHYDIDGRIPHDLSIPKQRNGPVSKARIVPKLERLLKKGDERRPLSLKQLMSKPRPEDIRTLETTGEDTQTIQTLETTGEDTAGTTDTREVTPSSESIRSEAVKPSESLLVARAPKSILKRNPSLSVQESMHNVEFYDNSSTSSEDETPSSEDKYSYRVYPAIVPPHTPEKQAHFERQQKIVKRLLSKEGISPESVDAQYLLQREEFYPHLYVYGNKGNNIRLNSLIYKGKRVSVVAASLHDGISERKLVVKHYYKPEVKDTTHEIGVYHLLRKSIDPRHLDRLLPWFSTGYQFYGEPVMVMEALNRLDHEDNAYQVGADIIHHLSYLHGIGGIHCDIKPDNIMSKSPAGGKTRVYYLIDFGGVTMLKLEEGWERFIWTPKWTVQEPKKGRIVFPKHDLLELGVTMRALQIWNEQGAKTELRRDQIHTGFRGRLRRYMHRVNSLPYTDYYHPSVYRELADILLKPRG